MEEMIVTDDRRDVGWIDSRRFIENRNQMPAEVVRPYAGKHVPWSSAGLRILASGSDELDLDAKLRQAGIDPRRVVFDFIPPEETVLSSGTC
jgi:hypothetical protein